ncbi:Biopolymer transport protein ExbD/TolR [Labilithrix luteola]|uniref:Biopolymer transport protein ExbD/TolR n=1 Tax=Labilithrix luteola TaxID=1391654 RepID=A0A0K1PTV4_9BACT|nr:biopolymer transporter ExbD [Labilithrix luteola]AKU96973.1 Biopolymer transport protein ExbD/TolR [Labilithrix luteola]
MGFGGSSGKGVRSDINITPLVDVVLVLLIIFMVMTPVPLNELKLTVPDKEETVADTATPPDQIVVSVTKQGSLAINREPVESTALLARMQTILDGRPAKEKAVFFDVDDDANYGQVVDAMDSCRGAGARVLGIMTR